MGRKSIVDTWQLELLQHSNVAEAQAKFILRNLNGNRVLKWTLQCWRHVHVHVPVMSCCCCLSFYFYADLALDMVAACKVNPAVTRTSCLRKLIVQVTQVPPPLPSLTPAKLLLHWSTLKNVPDYW